MLASARAISNPSAKKNRPVRASDVGLQGPHPHQATQRGHASKDGWGPHPHTTNGCSEAR
eukprot:3249523-Pyramimonas_sp.AAC.1